MQEEGGRQEEEEEEQRFSPVRCWYLTAMIHASFTTTPATTKSCRPVYRARTRWSFLKPPTQARDLAKGIEDNPRVLGQRHPMHPEAFESAPISSEIPKPAPTSAGTPKPAQISSEIPKPAPTSAGTPKPAPISSEIPTSTD